MKTYVFKIDVREKDVDGNKIDTEKEFNRVISFLKKLWNVESFTYFSYQKD